MENITLFAVSFVLSFVGGFLCGRTGRKVKFPKTVIVNNNKVTISSIKVEDCHTFDKRIYVQGLVRYYGPNKGDLEKKKTRYSLIVQSDGKAKLSAEDEDFEDNVDISEFQRLLQEEMRGLGGDNGKNS